MHIISWPPIRRPTRPSGATDEEVAIGLRDALQRLPCKEVDLLDAGQTRAQNTAGSPCWLHAWGQLYAGLLRSRHQGNAEVERGLL